ncbi:MAG: hypothetical protein U0325_00585 [Polyangiales bacterium]
MVDLTDAPQLARHAMAVHTHALVSSWWPALTLEAYERDYYSPRHWLIRVYTWEDAHGQPAAMLVGGAVDVEVDGDPLTVIRGAVCKRPDVPFLAGEITQGLVRGLVEAALHAYRRGRIPVARAVLSSPRGFALFHDAAPRCYPSHRSTTDDPRFRRWYEALRDDLGEPVEGESPYVVHGIPFDVPDAIRARWARSDDPAMRFFLEHCPDYGRGRELVALLPLEFSDLLKMPYTLARTSTVRAVRRAQRTLQPRAAED